MLRDSTCKQHRGCIGCITGDRRDRGAAHCDAAVLGEQLGGDAAEGAQHGPARVDDLDLAVAREGLGVRGEAGRVPTCAAAIYSISPLHPLTALLTSFPYHAHAPASCMTWNWRTTTNSTLECVANK